MKRLVLLLVLLSLVLWLGIKIHENPGQVVVTYEHWHIETALWVAVIALLALIAIAHLLLRLLSSMMQLPSRIRSWSKHRVLAKAGALLEHGLCALAEGKWQEAESSSLKAAKQSPYTLASYFSAAEAAQRQGLYDRRDQYLEKAAREIQHSSLAIGLTQARLQLQSGQVASALATLQPLQTKKPNHPLVLKLLVQTYQQSKDWKLILPLLVKLRKYQILSQNQLNELELQCHQYLLETTPTHWETLAKPNRENPILVAIYVRYLWQQKEIEPALILLSNTLKKYQDSALLLLYSQIIGADPAKQLSRAESWLDKQNEDPVLLLVLGRLCVTNRLWGKAKSYLERSSQLQPCLEVFAELATILQRLGEHDQALKCYQKAVAYQTQKNRK